MTVFVHQSEFEETEQKVLAGIHRAVNPDSVNLESDLALIAVVGRGMNLSVEQRDVFFRTGTLQVSMSR